MKKLRSEITSQLDKEHRDMLQQYDELWDKLLADMCTESHIAGQRMNNK